LLLQWLFDMNESWSGIAIAGIGEWQVWAPITWHWQTIKLMAAISG
jgi:hypothetical protein